MFPGLDKVMAMGRELLAELQMLRVDVRELTSELRRRREHV